MQRSQRHHSHSISVRFPSLSPVTPPPSVPSMSDCTCLSSPSRSECATNYQALRMPIKGQAPGALRALLLRLPSPHHTAFSSLRSIPRLVVCALPPGRTTGAGRRASPPHVTVLLWRSAHRGSCRLLDVRFAELKEPNRSSSSCSLWSTSTARRPWSQDGATPCFASSNRSQPARLLSSPCQLEERHRSCRCCHLVASDPDRPPPSIFPTDAWHHHKNHDIKLVLRRVARRPHPDRLHHFPNSLLSLRATCHRTPLPVSSSSARTCLCFSVRPSCFPFIHYRIRCLCREPQSS
jgi:hypothetical protein